METPAQTPEGIRLDAASRIDVDLHCLKCGYNLRGLLPSGLCPECGTPVGRSEHGDLLRFCSPDWVEAVASGFNWIVASIVLGILLGCGAGLLASLMGKGASAISLVGVAGAVVSFIGYWKATTPDPSRLDRETSMTARKLTRITIVVNLLLNTPEQLIAIPVPSIKILLLGATGIVGIVNTFASLIYAQQLATRIPDLSLAKQTRIVMWGMVVLGAAGIGVAALGAFAGPVTALTLSGAGTSATTGGPMVGVIVGGCVIGASGLVFGIWGLLLLFRYRREMLEAARQARDTWAKAPVQLLTPPADQ